MPRAALPLFRLHSFDLTGWASAQAGCLSRAKRASSEDWHEEDAFLPVSPFWLASGDTQRQIGFRIARPLDPPTKKDRNRFWNANVNELKKAVEIYISLRCPGSAALSWMRRCQKCGVVMDAALSWNMLDAIQRNQDRNPLYSSLI